MRDGGYQPQGFSRTTRGFVNIPPEHVDKYVIDSRDLKKRRLVYFGKKDLSEEAPEISLCGLIRRQYQTFIIQGLIRTLYYHTSKYIYSYLFTSLTAASFSQL